MHQDQSRAGRPASWRLRALGAGGRVLNSSHLGAAHLGGEATVAFVDGELAAGAHQRAAAHLAVCAECASDVQAQFQARAAIRAASTPYPPAGLLGVLRQIPTAHPAARLAPAGDPGRGAVVLGADGGWISVLRPDRYRNAAGDDDGASRRPGFPLAVLAVVLLTVGAGVGVGGVPASAASPPAGANSSAAAQV